MWIIIEHVMKEWRFGMRCELSQIEGTHYLRQTNSHSEYAVQAIDFL